MTGGGGDEARCAARAGGRLGGDVERLRAGEIFYRGTLGALRGRRIQTIGMMSQRAASFRAKASKSSGGSRLKSSGSPVRGCAKPSVRA